MNPNPKRLFLSIALVAALASCGGGGDDPKPGASSSPSQSSSAATSYPSGENISVSNPNGKFYTESTASPAANLPIFAAKGKGDVPYVNVADFVDVFTASSGLQDLHYAVEGKSGVLTCGKTPASKAIVDAEKNEIRLVDYANLVGSVVMSNGYGRDYCIANSTQAVRGSTKTTAIEKGEAEVILRLSDYGLNVYSEGGKVYAPLELLQTVLNNASLTNCVYNGKDYFASPESFKNTEITSYCYSGNNGFTYSWRGYDDIYRVNFRLTTPKEGEKYRFVSLDSDDKESGDYFISLLPDGTGKIYNVYGGKASEVVFNNMVRRLYYEVQDEVMTFYVLELIPETEGSASKENYTFAMKLNLGKTRYGLKTRSQEVCQYNYGLLCLTFDRFYGNKAFKTQGSFDSYITSLGIKERLLSTDSATYGEAMYEFLAKHIGDGHTAMTSVPMYSTPNSKALNDYETKYPSSRVKAIRDRQFQSYGQRYDALGHGVGNRFYDVVGSTALISFDVFALEGWPTYFRNYMGVDSEVAQRDTCAFFAGAIMAIEEYNKTAEKKIKNIVVDLTANGGGAMPAMPYLAGIMTKDPSIRVKDETSGRVVEYHYECDYDGDGVYGDTYADKYNWAVMVSGGSFSCATSFPSMLKGTNVKIVGEKSAGGAAPVTHFTDASGVTFQTSGSNILVYRDAAGKLVSIEEGVPVDVEVPDDIRYDLTKLPAKIGWTD